MGERWDGYSGGDGANIFGEPTSPPKPVAAEFASLWPVGTPGVEAAGKPGHEQLPKQSVIEPAPTKPGGKRPKRRRQKSPKTPAPYRTTKSAPGADQVDRDRRPPEGLGAK